MIPLNNAKQTTPVLETSANSRYATSRSVQPELLDGRSQASSLPQTSRRDLHLLDRLLRNHAWIKSELKACRWAREPVLELGAGSDGLGRSLSEQVSDFAGLDICRRPDDWPKLAAWFEADVLDFSSWARYPIVIGNLFFHYLDSVGLSRVGTFLNSNAWVIIVSEPSRRRRTTLLFDLLCSLIRAHQVTRHDGRASIAAGFRGNELPRLLHLDPDIWRWRIQETWLGSYRLMAKRRE
jgi:hypothetical protein